jgi:putative SOS response-associated peptidase YedK
VPASGFYVWARAGGANHKSTGTPFAFALKSRAWFCFAGLWSRAIIDGSEFDTFAIITTEPNLAVAGLSASMPVILDPATYIRWLDLEARDPMALLKACPSNDLQAWPANPAVGNVRNQGPDLLRE